MKYEYERARQMYFMIQKHTCQIEREKNRKIKYFAQYLVKEGKYADELPRIICTFPNCCY